MKVAVTGGTGFIGRHLVAQLLDDGHEVRCAYRASSDRGGMPHSVEWFEADLSSPDRFSGLVTGCDAVVHAALYHPSGRFREDDADLGPYLSRNLMGSILLIEEARKAGVARLVFVSTCAVHEKILDDRPLDEAHPLWMTSHYGAYKAAVEAFVHSYGKGHGFGICAIRPSGVYGVARPVEQSKWYDLVKAVSRGETVSCRRGGKEVHAADVARGIRLVLQKGEAGEVYSCTDRYISDFEVATLARRLSNSAAVIEGGPTQPKHQISTEKIRALGMKFGGEALLEKTIAELVNC